MIKAYTLFLLDKLKFMETTRGTPAIEGRIAKAIEEKTSKIPSDNFSLGSARFDGSFALCKINETSA